MGFIPWDYTWDKQWPGSVTGGLYLDPFMLPRAQVPRGSPEPPMFSHKKGNKGVPTHNFAKSTYGRSCHWDSTRIWLCLVKDFLWLHPFDLDRPVFWKLSLVRSGISIIVFKQFFPNQGINNVKTVAKRWPWLDFTPRVGTRGYERPWRMASSGLL